MSGSDSPRQNTPNAANSKVFVRLTLRQAPPASAPVAGTKGHQNGHQMDQLCDLNSRGWMRRPGRPGGVEIGVPAEPGWGPPFGCRQWDPASGWPSRACQPGMAAPPCCVTNISDVARHFPPRCASFSLNTRPFGHPLLRRSKATWRLPPSIGEHSPGPAASGRIRSMGVVFMTAVSSDSKAEPFALSLNQLAQRSSLSRRSIERAVANGALRSRRIGGRRIILRADALRWLSRDQPSGGAQ